MMGYLFGGKHQAAAEQTEEAARKISEALPQTVEPFRSDRARNWEKEIRKEYNPQGGWLFAGDVASTAGQAFPALAAGSYASFLSPAVGYMASAGNAAAAAREQGASDQEAYLYSVASGGVDAALDKLSGSLSSKINQGIGDVGGPVLQNMVQMLGDGAGSYASEMADTALQRIWNGSDSSLLEDLTAAQKDALRSAMVDVIGNRIVQFPEDVSQDSPKNSAQPSGDASAKDANAQKSSEDLHQQELAAEQQDFELAKEAMQFRADLEKALEGLAPGTDAYDHARTKFLMEALSQNSEWQKNLPLNWQPGTVFKYNR